MDNIKIIFTFAAVLLIVPMIEALGKMGPKFIIHEAVDASPKNDYFSNMEVRVRDKEFTSNAIKILKPLPEEIMVHTRIVYNNMEVPEHTMLLCDALGDEVFGKDVNDCLYPMPGFPVQCPINATDFIIGIEDYKFPHYKIPPNTAPGPVIVNISYVYEGEVLWKMNTVGEIIVDYVDY